MPRVLKERQGAKTTWYVYGNGLIGQETTSNDIGTNLINRQIQSANPKQSIGKAYRSYHYDQQGNTILLTDEKGEVKARYSYDPYGQVLAHQGEDTVYQYSGKYGIETDQTKLLYMRARYYDPNSKRFLGQDILMGNLSDIRSLNRYAYVEGNPMKYIDPTGMFAQSSAYEHTGYGKWKKPKPTKKNEQKKSSVPSKPSKVRDEKTVQQMLRDMTEEQLWEIAGNCQDPRQGNAAQALYLKYSAEAKKAGLEAKIWGGISNSGIWVAKRVHWIPGVGVAYTTYEGIYVTLTGDAQSYNFDNLSVEDYYLSWESRQTVGITSTVYFANFVQMMGMDQEIFSSPNNNQGVSTPTVDVPSPPEPQPREIVKSNLGNEYDITPSENHSIVHGSSKTHGEPNSSIDIYNRKGVLQTRRWYGPDGRAYRDIDFTQHGNPSDHPEFPHEHFWDWTNPDHPDRPEKPR